MPRTTILQVSGLEDPLAQYNCDLMIPTVPGAGAHDATSFKTKIMTSALPGRTIEPIPIELHGVSIEFAGRVQYNRTLPFELLEVRDMKSRDTLLQWHNYCRNNSSLGTYHQEYATTVFIEAYDEKGNMLRQIRLNKTWLESFDDSTFDGSASTPITVSGTLRYFTHTDIGVSGVEQDG